MSKYTTEVRFICENFAGYDESQGFSSVDQIISAALPKVFPFEVPIFDPAYKTVLCTKILRHYYTREIGSETVGLWQLRMQTKLISPKIIVCLGRISAMRLIKPDFKITKEHGQWFEKNGYLMTAVYHPSALLRDVSKRPETFRDLLSIREAAKNLNITI